MIFKYKLLILDNVIQYACLQSFFSFGAEERYHSDRPPCRTCFLEEELMSIQVSALPNEHGFVNESVGAHSSRTMMLAELRLLLAACQPSSSLEDYRSAIVNENVLLKKTVTTRKNSFRWLRELYALNRKMLLFRALRDLWDEETQAQPLLALLCTAARDHILKGTAEGILAIPLGETVTPTMIAQTVNTNFPNRYKPNTLASIGRNAISTWQQAGLLSGKLHKVRVRAESRPASVAYALLLGYLSGARGEALFRTLWCRLLDTPVNVLHEQAFAASQRGWIEYRHMGDVTEIGFRYLLRK
jgi:hypothetical protein